MGGWQNLRAHCLKILRTRAAQAALSVGGHVLVLGGLLLANPWRQAPVLPEPPLIVDLITLTVAEEKKTEEAPAPGRPSPPPPVPKPAPKPAAVSKPAPAPARKPPNDRPPASEIILAPMDAPGSADTPDSGDTTAPAPYPGAAGVDPAVGQAIAALFCRRMDEDERYAAGCAEQPAIDPFERPPAIAMLTPEERRIQAIRTQQLARTAGYGNFLEWYLAHEAVIPKTLPGGIDNSIFMDRKDEATMQQERLARGGTPDWAADIARAHGQE